MIKKKGIWENQMPFEYSIVNSKLLKQLNLS